MREIIGFLIRLFFAVSMGFGFHICVIDFIHSPKDPTYGTMGWEQSVFVSLSIVCPLGSVLGILAERIIFNIPAFFSWILTSFALSATSILGLLTGLLLYVIPSCASMTIYGIILAFVIYAKPIYMGLLRLSMMRKQSKRPATYTKCLTDFMIFSLALVAGLVALLFLYVGMGVGVISGLVGFHVVFLSLMVVNSSVQTLLIKLRGSSERLKER
jgi:hypothetical protein